jgi:hypothetical protein
MSTLGHITTLSVNVGKMEIWFTIMPKTEDLFVLYKIMFIG